MAEFNPVTSLAGGVLIGLAVGSLWLFNGRIAGIAGILGSAFTTRVDAGAWRWLFLVGLVGGGLAMRAIDAGFFPRGVEGPVGLAVVAGLAVGVGTRIGGGCTSGHGVCGMARLSPRSVTATFVFTVAGGITVLLVRTLGQGG